MAGGSNQYTNLPRLICSRSPNSGCNSPAVLRIWRFPNWVMSTLCYALMIGPVYLLHRRFTFPSEAPHRQALPRYVGVQVMALLLASLFGFVAYRMLGLPTLWASLFVTVLTSGLNFMVLKIWAFAHHPRAEAAADAALATPAES